MDAATFWELIERIDREAIGDDGESATAPLVDALAEMPADEIEGFETILSEKLFALDGKRFADRVSAESDDGYVSADAFLYARCFVVAQGKKFYESVLNDPALMPRATDDWFEDLLYVAASAYKEATGDDWAFDAELSYETGSNAAEW